MSDAGRRDAGELPLEQYAALGDGRSVALVGADGSIDWWGVPNLDSAPLFDRILDPEFGGRFSITPVETFTVERRYRDDSNVLEQTYATASGSARITDSLNSGISGRLPWSELARRIEGLQGTVEFRIESLAGRYLDRATPWRQESAQVDVVHIDGVVTALRSCDAFERTHESDRGVSGRIVTSPGSRATLALLASRDGPLIIPEIKAIDARIDRSDQSWREWARGLTFEGPYASDVRRSALALKLLIFSPTGAIAAAATTSLPERIGGDKNYDYRYVWVRDVTYSVKALLLVGATEEATAAFNWLVATLRRNEDRFCTMYTLDGDDAPAEEELALPGYRESTPVRKGNRARNQLQIGIYGDVLACAALFVDQGHVLDLLTRSLLARIADECADIWKQRDSGIWELDDLQNYTMSKMGAWTALDCAASLARKGELDAAHLGRWERERDRVRKFIDTECWSEREQSYTFYAGSELLDASLLLAVRSAFPDRERLAATRDAVRRKLSSGALVYRYGGMDREEATFTACGFWMVEAYALLGKRAEAIEQMDGMLAKTNANLGVFHEQIDAKTGMMLGNFPQALSHLALIQAAAAIADAVDEIRDEASTPRVKRRADRTEPR